MEMELFLEPKGSGVFMALHHPDLKGAPLPQHRLCRECSILGFGFGFYPSHLALSRCYCVNMTVRDGVLQQPCYCRNTHFRVTSKVSGFLFC